MECRETGKYWYRDARKTRVILVAYAGGISSCLFDGIPVRTGPGLEI